MHHILHCPEQIVVIPMEQAWYPVPSSFSAALGADVEPGVSNFDMESSARTK